MEGTGMEESISRLPEDCRHLVVVVGHELWFGRLFGKREEAMDILHSLKCFLKVKQIDENLNFTSNTSQIIFNNQLIVYFTWTDTAINDLLLKKHSYLPQFHAYSAVQLDQACLQVHGLAFRVVEINGSALVVVALDLTQVHTQVVTKLAELGFAGVLKAKLERCGKG